MRVELHLGAIHPLLRPLKHQLEGMHQLQQPRQGLRPYLVLYRQLAPLPIQQRLACELIHQQEQQSEYLQLEFQHPLEQLGMASCNALVILQLIAGTVHV